MGNSSSNSIPSASNYSNYPRGRQPQQQQQQYNTHASNLRSGQNTQNNRQRPYPNSRPEYNYPNTRQNPPPQQSQRYTSETNNARQTSSASQNTNNFQNNTQHRSSNSSQQQTQQNRTYRPHASTLKQKVVTSNNAIDKLPTVKYTVQREELMQHCFDSCTCSICMDDFVYEDNLIMLPCQHIFHNDCIKPWLKQHSNVCPVCRFELEVGDYQQDLERRNKMIERFTEDGLKIIESQSEIERFLEEIYQIDRIYEQKKHVENLHSDDIIEMRKQLDHFDTMLENKTFFLDNISQLQNDKLKEQKKYCIRKIQGIQKYIFQLKQKLNVCL